MPNNSHHIATVHIEDLEEKKPLPDLTEPQRQQQKIKDIHNIDNQLDSNALPNCVTIHNIDDQLDTTILPNCVTIHNADNQLDINTLPNCVTNHEKQRAIHSERAALTNTVFMTKILAKKSSITWRCYIPLPLVLICLFILWSLLRKAQTASVPALNLGPLCDCSQPRHLGIFVFPSLKNYSHNMLQQEATVSRFLGKVFHNSPINQK